METNKTAKFPVTGDTITDEQIRQLRSSPGSDGDPEFVVRMCDLALAEVRHLSEQERVFALGFTGEDPVIRRHRARARCAAIWNVRFR